MNKETLHKAINLARVGLKNEALPLLKQALEEDPYDEIGWLWLADCQPTLAEKIHVLEGFVSMVPEASRARAGLDALRKMESASQTTAIEPELDSQPPETVQPDEGQISRQPAPWHEQVIPQEATPTDIFVIKPVEKAAKELPVAEELSAAEDQQIIEDLLAAGETSEISEQQAVDGLPTASEPGTLDEISVIAEEQPVGEDLTSINYEKSAPAFTLPDEETPSSTDDLFAVGNQWEPDQTGKESMEEKISSWMAQSTPEESPENDIFFIPPIEDQSPAAEEGLPSIEELLSRGSLWEPEKESTESAAIEFQGGEESIGEVEFPAEGEETPTAEEELTSSSIDELLANMKLWDTEKESTETEAGVIPAEEETPGEFEFPTAEEITTPSGVDELPSLEELLAGPSLWEKEQASTEQETPELPEAAELAGEESPSDEVAPETEQTAPWMGMVFPQESPETDIFIIPPPEERPVVKSTSGEEGLPSLDDIFAKRGMWEPEQFVEESAAEELPATEELPAAGELPSDEELPVFDLPQADGTPGEDSSPEEIAIPWMEGQPDDSAGLETLPVAETDKDNWQTLIDSLRSETAQGEAKDAAEQVSAELRMEQPEQTEVIIPAVVPPAGFDKAGEERLSELEKTAPRRTVKPQATDAAKPYPTRKKPAKVAAKKGIPVLNILLIALFIIGLLGLLAVLAVMFLL